MVYFRVRKSVPLSVRRQGYIYYKSLCYPELPERAKRRIAELCSLAGGEYAAALQEYVTTDRSATAVCLRHHISRGTLERAVRKYYRMWPRSL